MAMLEIHDAQGQVRRVPVARDETLLFGSSAQCNLPLNDPAVLPFHGRLRWKRDQIKVDASPQAEYILLNGQKMTSATFRQGDEIQVGSCRIFLIHAGADTPDEPRVTQPAAEREHGRVPSQRAGTGAGAGAGPAAYEAPLIAQDFAFDPDDDDAGADDDIVELDSPITPAAVAPPGREAERTGSAPLPRMWRRLLEDKPKTPGEALPGRRTPAAAPARPRPLSDRMNRGWGGLIRALRAQDMPPGEERILSSPLVVSLVVALLLLVLASVALWGIIQRTVAARLYNQAVELFNDGDYRNALRRYDEFLAGYPGDARVGKARVLRALANVRQFTSSAGASWSDALEAEQAMYRTVAREPSYRDSSTDLAELVVQTALNLAERARASADASTLAEAEAAVALHARVAGKPAATLLARSRVPGKLAEAKAAVLKATVRAQALAAMDAALKAGSSAGVYAARDALVGRYADLAEDRELIKRMRAANELIRRAVTVDDSGRPAETEPRTEPLGPPTSLVLRLTGTGPVAAAGRADDGPLVFALADGFAYGLAASDGAPLWHVPVGLSAPFPPQPVDGGTAVLLVDARFDALEKRTARTGVLQWRQALGAPISDPPLVLGNQVIAATHPGDLCLIDLESGALRATVHLGLPLARTPVGDETGQFLYVLADKDCLFVLRRDPLQCAAVEYLGHAAGAVAAAPARLGRFLVVAQNHTPSDSRWHVFVIDEDGIKLRPVQQEQLPGWTWSTPASAGSVLWATGDKGGITAFAAGTYEERSPLRALARLSPDVQASGPAFALARSERELLVASGHSGRLELNPDNGKITLAWTLSEAGPALAPPQLAGGRLVFNQQSTEGPGAALWGVDPATGQVHWRTVLGAPWRIPLAAGPGGDALSTLNEEGRALVLPRTRMAAGGFVEVAIPKPGGTRLPSGPFHRLDTGESGAGLTLLVPPAGASHLLVRAGDGGFQRVALPAAIEAMPVLWGTDLLVPGRGGRADLIDPRTGAPRAEPFLAPYDSVHPTRWRGAAAVDGDAVVLAEQSGRVRRLSRSAGALPLPLPRLEVSAEHTLGSSLAADPLGSGGAVLLVTAEGRIRALAGRDLSPIGAWPLEAPAPLATPPAHVAGRGFLADRAGNVHAFGPDGQRLWSITLRAGAAAGPPAVVGNTVWFLGQNGALESHALSDGSLLDHAALDILPAGDLLALEDQLIVPVSPGTLRMLRSDR